MTISKRMRRTFVVLGVAGLLCVWYIVAANYDYGALAGTYAFEGDGTRCTLSLRADRTFTEELVLDGHSQTVDGTWHRYGEAHVSFSKDFLKLAGEELNADGEAHGQFDKTLGLLPSLTLAPVPGGPVLRRRLF